MSFTERLERRQLLTVDLPPIGNSVELPPLPTDQLPYTPAPDGWTVGYDRFNWVDSIYIEGPDTDDRVTVRRNTDRARAVDLDLNGQVMTIDYDNPLAPHVNWRIDLGGGDDRLEVLLGPGDEFGIGGVYGADGNDLLINGDVPGGMYGGPGDDVLVGGDARDWFEAGTGIDSLFGGGGDDDFYTGVDPAGHTREEMYLQVQEGEIFDGGPGNDMITNGFSRDELKDLDPEPALPPLDKPKPSPKPAPQPESPPPTILYDDNSGDWIVNTTTGVIKVRVSGPAAPPAADGSVQLTAEVATDLVTAGPPDPAAGASSPALDVSFRGRRAARRGPGYAFTVVYSAAAGSRVDPASVRGAVTVEGPGGYSTAAELLSTKARRKGSVLVARYRAAAPGGAFDATDSGTYAVRVTKGSVAVRPAGGAEVALGQVVTADPSEQIGGFQVTAAARRPRPVPRALEVVG
jgi:hypothetical protein